MADTQRPNKINGSILNEVSERICLRLQLDRASKKVSDYSFAPEELKSLPDLHFLACNLDASGERRLAIKS